MTTVADPAVGPVTSTAESVRRTREATLASVQTHLAEIRREADKQAGRVEGGFEPSAKRLLELTQGLGLLVTRAEEQLHQVNRLQSLAQQLSGGR